MSDTISDPFFDKTETLQQGLRLQLSGDLQGAANLYIEALEADPDYPDAHHLLGLVYYGAGRIEEALTHIRKALAIQSHFPAAHCNLGSILWMAKKDTEAACASLEEALLQDPQLPDALRTLAKVYLEKGRIKEAEALLRRLLEQIPNDPDALLTRGKLLLQRGDPLLALESVARALRIQHEDKKAWGPIGKMLLKANLGDFAIVCFEQGLKESPDDAELLNQLGLTQQNLGRLGEALVTFRKGHALYPSDHYFIGNIGQILGMQGKAEEAANWFRKALELDPDNVVHHSNLGNALLGSMQLEESVSVLEQALVRWPGHRTVRYNLGNALLMAGHLERGWTLFEERWNTVKVQERRNFPQPLWDGSQDIAGKTVYLHAEQGLGDTIQFMRYCSLVKAQGAKVILEVPTLLLSLAARIQGLDMLVARGQQPPPFDYHCPLMSLPTAFRTSLDTIPRAVPYLRALPPKVELWRQRLSSAKGPKVALTWSGNPRHENDYKRSIPLASLAALAKGHPEISFLGIQKEIRDSDKAVLKELPQLNDLSRLIESFEDTAAIMELADLVISVDTSVIHLAGALGRPTWVMLAHCPDWRWMADRDDSPWYPSLRLFRQPAPEDWSSVLKNVDVALAELRPQGA